MSRATTSKKIAIKIENADAAILKKLAVTLLGAKDIFDEDGTVATLLPDGTLIELYASHACFPEYLFANSNTVVSYKVADIATAVEQAIAMGLTKLTDIIPVGSIVRYCHLKLPDGTVIGFYEEKFN